MANKINVAELLKDCPNGMELDCTMYDNLYFDSLNADYYGTINCYTLIDGIKTSINFTKYGTFNNHIGAKCVIFPKGKTTWEGFVPPCKFKEGDVVVCNYGDIHLLRTEDSSYCSYRHRRETKLDPILTTSIAVVRLATEEEKKKLFKAIKDNGYRWNDETKTLIKPKFNVGDKIRNFVVNLGNIYTVLNVETSGYTIKKDNEFINCHITFDEANNWELAPNKFDINTLVPFESRVLVRNENNRTWRPAVFGCYIKNHYDSFYVLGGNSWKHCIPYKGNEHLCGTANDCDDFYKTWK